MNVNGGFVQGLWLLYAPSLCPTALPPGIWTRVSEEEGAPIPGVPPMQQHLAWMHCPVRRWSSGWDGRAGSREHPHPPDQLPSLGMLWWSHYLHWRLWMCVWGQDVAWCCLIFLELYTGVPTDIRGSCWSISREEEKLRVLALAAKLLRGVSVTVKSGLLKAWIIEWVDLASSFRAISPHMHLVILHWKHTGEIMSFFG